VRVRRGGRSQDARKQWTLPEGITTEEPITVVDSVSSEPIIDSHHAEEFGSQDVVGE